MSATLIAIVSIVVGFIGLIWSADRFVIGASTTARNMGVSPLIIGMTIVAFGTSSPEIITSVVASLQGAPGLALGNVIGSNIANIGLVLGLTLLVSPLAIPSSLVKKELPALLGLTLVCFFLLQDLSLNAIDGIILLFILALFAWIVLSNALKANSEKNDTAEIEEYLSSISTIKAFGLMGIGLALMLVSSYILVFGARSIASTLGFSELVIGLTVVAIGTSLPELATTITSALKGHSELALGNIVGSNILNLLLVLPVPAFLSPFQIEDSVIWRDYLIMLIMTLLIFFPTLFLFLKKKPLGRIAGSVLLILYIAYTAYLLSNSA